MKCERWLARRRLSAASQLWASALRAAADAAGRAGPAAGWQGLDDDVQDDRLQQTWRLIWAWAQRCGADQMEGDFTRADWPVVAAAGLSQRSGSRYRWGGTLSATSLDGLCEANPERLWITIRGELIVYLHETWDSVVVRAGEEELRELQRDVTALQAQWS